MHTRAVESSTEAKQGAAAGLALVQTWEVRECDSDTLTYFLKQDLNR